MTVPVLTLSLAWTGIADGHSDRKKTCVPSNGRVLTANRLATVYSIPGKEGTGTFPEYRGCLNNGKKSYYIGSPPSGSSSGASGTTHVTLNGTTAAYEQFGSITERGFGSGSNKWYVVVRDLRNGRIVHKVPTGFPLEPKSTYIGVGAVVALVVRNNGAVAWIAEDYERSRSMTTSSEQPYFDVEKVDKAGEQLLAAGPGIDPSSLALAVGSSNIGHGASSIPGTSVYWSQDGQPHSAPLN